MATKSKHWPKLLVFKPQTLLSCPYFDFFQYIRAHVSYVGASSKQNFRRCCFFFTAFFFFPFFSPISNGRNVGKMNLFWYHSVQYSCSFGNPHTKTTTNSCIFVKLSVAWNERFCRFSFRCTLISAAAVNFLVKEKIEYQLRYHLIL